MNIVDSSGWLEYFADAPNAAFFAPALEDMAKLLIPVISIYEVFKRVLQQQGEQKALEVIAVMMQGRILELDVTTALSAAKLSSELKLPMADSLILAAARQHQALLWTQDIDFASMDDVKYVSKQP